MECVKIVTILVKNVQLLILAQSVLLLITEHMTQILIHVHVMLVTMMMELNYVNHVFQNVLLVALELNVTLVRIGEMSVSLMNAHAQVTNMNQMLPQQNVPIVTNNV